MNLFTETDSRFAVLTESGHISSDDEEERGEYSIHILSPIHPISNLSITISIIIY